MQRAMFFFIKKISFALVKNKIVLDTARSVTYKTYLLKFLFTLILIELFTKKERINFIVIITD